MKRFFCLLLVLCALLCLAAPAGAEEQPEAFTDAGSIRHYSQVTMLVDLGLISGYGDGSFRPDSCVTRAEIAKLIALVYADNPQADGGTSFPDAAGSWAERYIRYCAEKGIVAGSGGLFRPNDYVTAQELAKMLLVVIGRGSTGYVGSGWADAVNRDAEALGIYQGYTSAYDTPITRDDTCLLIYNALQCSAVTGKAASGALTYALDDLMNPKSYLEVRFGLVRYTGVMTGNECADLTTDGGTLEAGTTKLAGHKAFQVSSDLSLLGRTVDIFVRDGSVVGLPCAAAGEVAHTFSQADNMAATLATTGYRTTAETEYYSNFDRADAGILDELPAGALVTVIDHTGDQKIDVVLVTSFEKATVAGASPLTVQRGAEALQVRHFCVSDVFRRGDEVLYTEICGVGYIRAE